MCQELTDFFLAVLLLLIICLGSSSAQMCELNGRFTGASNGAGPANSSATISSIDEAIGVEVQNWRGFAAKDDESLPVKLTVQTIRSVDPAEARRLLASNLSLEEVRFLVGTDDEKTLLRGRITINNDSYRLMDIQLSYLNNRSSLEANIADRMSISDSEDATSVVGNLVVAISEVDGSKAAEGYVVIDDSKYRGTYDLKLNECSGKGPRAGRLGRQ